MTDIIRSPRRRARRVRSYVSDWGGASQACVGITDLDRLAVLVQGLLRTAAVMR